MWQVELHIFYVESALYPHRLIVGLNIQDFPCLVVDSFSVIEVFGAEEHVEGIVFHHIRGVCEEEIRVGLEMYDAIIDKETSVSLQEESGSKALMHILHLRVGEGKPYLLHLILGKEAVDYLDIGT